MSLAQCINVERMALAAPFLIILDTSVSTAVCLDTSKYSSVTQAGLTWGNYGNFGRNGQRSLH